MREKIKNARYREAGASFGLHIIAFYVVCDAGRKFIGTSLNSCCSPVFSEALTIKDGVPMCLQCVILSHLVVVCHRQNLNL